MSGASEFGSAEHEISRYSSDDRSKANTLLTTLANLRTKEAKLDEAIKDKDREAMVQMDRRERTENLRNETTDLQNKTNENTTYIEAAREVVNSFPGDTQILRLERKLESLQNEIKEADRTLKQRRTGVEAYQAKIHALQQGRETVLSEMASVMRVMEVQASNELENHAAFEQISMKDGIETLSGVCTERESELDGLNTKLQEKYNRDKDLTKQLQQLQETVSDTIPRVESEKDQDIEGILGKWEIERTHLLAIYGKLCIVNREQNYHLMRGTHIKRPPPKSSHLHESRLELDNTDLAREVNMLKEKDQIVRDEVKALHVALNGLKKTSDKERKHFHALKNKADDRVREAIEGRRELQIENQELQKMKNELLDLLQGLRENQISIQKASIGTKSTTHNNNGHEGSTQRTDFRRTE